MRDYTKSYAGDPKGTHGVIIHHDGSVHFRFGKDGAYQGSEPLGDTTRNPSRQAAVDRILALFEQAGVVEYEVLHAHTSGTNQLAEGNLRDVLNADSPQRFASAMERLLSILADSCCEAACELEHAWQEKSVGVPWTRLARQLEGFSLAMRASAKARS